VGIVLLPGLLDKPLPTGTAVTGTFLTLLGVGSMAFHNGASETGTYKHKLDEIFMYSVFGWLAGVVWFSSYSAYTNRVPRARDPLEMLANCVGMVAVIVIIIRIETILLLGNELLGHFMLVVFSLAIMIGNAVTLTSLFWHLQRKGTPHRFLNALRKALPTLVVRLIHLQMAFSLKNAGEKYKTLAHQKIPRHVDTISGRQGFHKSLGFLPAGNDMNKANMTEHDAEVWCEPKPNCTGFTTLSADRRRTAVKQIFFKFHPSAKTLKTFSKGNAFYYRQDSPRGPPGRYYGAGNGDTAWVSYTKPEWNNNAIDKEVKFMWQRGAEALIDRANATGSKPEMLKIMSRRELVNDFKLVHTLGYNNWDGGSIMGDRMATYQTHWNFTYTFEERVEYRARHDFCHGMWHFHTACVIMGMALTVIIGTVNEDWDDDFEMPDDVGKWEKYAMGIEVLIALANACLEFPEGGSSRESHLAFVTVLVFVGLPTITYILLEILGLAASPIATIKALWEKREPIFSQADHRRKSLAFEAAQADDATHQGGGKTHAQKKWGKMRTVLSLSALAAKKQILADANAQLRAGSDGSTRSTMSKGNVSKADRAAAAQERWRKAFRGQTSFVMAPAGKNTNRNLFSSKRPGAAVPSCQDTDMSGISRMSTDRTTSGACHLLTSPEAPALVQRVDTWEVNHIDPCAVNNEQTQTVSVTLRHLTAV